MSEHMQLKVDISGANREAAASVLSKFFREQFGTEPARPDPQQGSDQTRSGDAMQQWITLVLSIPVALLATIDIVERTKLKERVQRLVEQIRQAVQGDGSVVLQVEERPALDVVYASPAEVVEALRPPEETPDGGAR